MFNKKNAARNCIKSRAKMATDNIYAMYEAHVIVLSVKHQRPSETLKRLKSHVPGR